MTNNKNKADDIYNKFKLDKKKLKELLEHEDAIQNTQKYLTSLLKEVTTPIPPLEKKTKFKKTTKDIDSLTKTYKSPKKESPTKEEKNSFSTKKSVLLNLSQPLILQCQKYLILKKLKHQT